MVKWGMVIDLRRCVGCHACTVACKFENFTAPGIYWNLVFDREEGEYPDVKRVFVPRPCMHCENPPCVKVCPTGATGKREDGIVFMNYEECIGCRYCEVACPYGVRYFNWGKRLYYGTKSTPHEEFSYDLRPSEHRKQLGTIEKCTLCSHKVDRAVEMGIKPDFNPDRRTQDDFKREKGIPACCLTCLGKARYFGDLDDPDSAVSKVLAGREWIRLLEELGTSPQVYYLVW
ncbi:MAG: 4Fe-4S dicluster domain-containing protein [Candidatus Bathyarchaeia archaeon]